jgi:hypothetical protein
MAVSPLARVVSEGPHSLLLAVERGAIRDEGHSPRRSWAGDPGAECVRRLVCGEPLGEVGVLALRAVSAMIGGMR